MEFKLNFDKAYIQVKPDIKVIKIQTNIIGSNMLFKIISNWDLSWLWNWFNWFIRHFRVICDMVFRTITRITGYGIANFKCTINNSKIISYNYN